MRGTRTILIAALAVASTATAKPSQPAPTPVEPEAPEALEKMSSFLGQQKSFTVRTETETDCVLDDGQKVRLSARGSVHVQRPSRLRAERLSDRKQRELYDDGKTFTIYSPKVGYYARRCGGTYYAPQYSGTDITYVVVENPEAAEANVPATP